MVIGNPHGQHTTLRVNDLISWKNIEIILCQIDKDSGANKRHAHRIEIDAVYKTVNQMITPPLA